MSGVARVPATRYEVETHGWHSRQRPAVGIRVTTWWPDAAATRKGHEFEGDDEFWKWASSAHESNVDPIWSPIEDAWTIASENGFDQASEDALEIFGPSVKACTEGRQGGWLVIHGLPSIDEWDDEMFGLWQDFCSQVVDQVADFAYQWAWHLRVNVYEGWADHIERQRVARIAGANRWADQLLSIGKEE